jgi:hypothetical protein
MRKTRNTQPAASVLDTINPDYYKPIDSTSPDIECIDAIHAALGTEGFLAFLRGTAIAYNWRMGRKDAAMLDARKAMWYADKIRNVLADQENV